MTITCLFREFELAGIETVISGVGGLFSVVHLQCQCQAVMKAAHLCQHRYGGVWCHMIYCMLVMDPFVFPQLIRH